MFVTYMYTKHFYYFKHLIHFAIVFSIPFLGEWARRHLPLIFDVAVDVCFWLSLMMHFTEQMIRYLRYKIEFSKIPENSDFLLKTWFLTQNVFFSLKMFSFPLQEVCWNPFLHMHSGSNSTVFQTILVWEFALADV